MKDLSLDTDGVLQLRGRISSAHPLYKHLDGVAPRIAFKLIAELAVEGIASKAATARVVSLDHPLSATLRGMSSHEALLFLVGVTKSQGEPGASRSVATPDAAPFDTPAPGRASSDLREGIAAGSSDDGGFNLDEEDLDAVLLVPAGCN